MHSTALSIPSVDHNIIGLLSYLTPLYPTVSSRFILRIFNPEGGKYESNLKYSFSLTFFNTVNLKEYQNDSVSVPGEWNSWKPSPIPAGVEPDSYRRRKRTDEYS
jgi:hypothetical protein